MSVFTQYIGLVCKIRNRDGDRVAAKVEGIEGRYLKLRFRTGLTALMNTDDILWIGPVVRQPKEMV